MSDSPLQKLYAFPGFSALPGTTENEYLRLANMATTERCAEDHVLGCDAGELQPLVSVGCCITKSEVIFKLMQEGEPWPLEGEFPGCSDPGK